MPTFKKTDRLSGKKDFESIFKSGNIIRETPWMLKWIKNEFHKPLVRMAVSVSKKHFKKAVTRNRIKRLAREAYRKHKLFVTEQIRPAEHGYSLLFVFIGKEVPAYKQVEEKIILILQRFIRQQCVR